jgi:mono/diheme cytochrome c family protein
LLAFSVHLAACTYEGAPDLRGEPLGVLRVERSFPEPGQLEVGTATWIDTIFNVPLAGESVADGADFRLFSGMVESHGRVTIDLLEQRIRFLPYQPLRPRLRYQMFLWGGVRGVNGARLSESRTFDFTVGTEPGPSLAPPTPPPPGAQIQAHFAARCARCHGPEGRAGLDLSSAQASRASLAGAPSEQSTLRRLLPGDHARSYLMRKLLGQGISGMPMPPEGAPLARAELRQVADWIDGGAQP